MPDVRRVTIQHEAKLMHLEKSDEDAPFIAIMAGDGAGRQAIYLTEDDIESMIGFLRGCLGSGAPS